MQKFEQKLGAQAHFVNFFQQAELDEAEEGQGLGDEGKTEAGREEEKSVDEPRG